MKTHLTIIILVFTAVAATSFADQHYSTQSPVAPMYPIDIQLPSAGLSPGAALSPFTSPTVPPTSYTSGLISTASQYNFYAGNLLITGNVAGDRHFRGVVPYGSTSETGILLDDPGSTSLNSFIRRSAANPYPLNRTQLTAIQPYYYPQQTVTSLLRNGQSGLKAPLIAPLDTTVGFEPLALALPKIKTETAYLQQRPLSMTTDDIEKLITEDLDFKEFKRLQIQLDSQRLQTESMGSIVTELEKFNINTLQPLELSKKTEKDLLEDNTLPKSYKPLRPILPGEEPELIPEKKTITDDQTDSILSELIKDLESETFEQPEDYQQQETEKTDQQKEPQDPDKLQLPQRPELPGLPETPGLPKFEQTLIPPLDPQKRLYIFAQEKFEKYMKSAAELLKQKQFYRAADACTFASIWNDKNPQAYAEKAHALFAAGEYMSSSYFIQKAFLVSPEYAKKTINIIETLGDKDIFDNRMAELAIWQKKSDSGELAFLIAYILYQSENAYAAERYIDMAKIKMPDRPAVKTLAEAIREAAKI
jgi:tetratricopeptide (TPR) repeat protein